MGQTVTFDSSTYQPTAQAVTFDQSSYQPHDPSIMDTLRANWHSNTDELPNPDNSAVIGAENLARGAAHFLGHAVMHPVDTFIGQPGQGILAGGATPYGTPINAPTGNQQLDAANQQAQQQAQQQQAQAIPQMIQHPAYSAGQMGGAALVAPALRGIVEAPNSVRTVLDLPQRAAQYLRPTSDPSIVPRSEFAARQLSAAVLPANKDATNFIQAAQSETPNVIDYARRTGNPLNTQLEFSKAAQGYAQDVRNFYEQDILGPSANKRVDTTGTGFGRRAGEAPNTYATLGDIDARVTEINKQLDAPALNADDARRALASKVELQNEAAGLREILHQNLSQSTGLSPDQIAEIRQRVGRSYELANDTNAAVTQRMQDVGKGQLKDISWSQLPSKAYNLTRGGPVAIADRAFQRAIANFPGQARPLPTIVPPGQ